MRRQNSQVTKVKKLETEYYSESTNREINLNDHYAPIRRTQLYSESSEARKQR